MRAEHRRTKATVWPPRKPPVRAWQSRSGARGRRVPLSVEVLQSGIDRLASALQFPSGLGCRHSGIKHVLKLLFFRTRPAAPDRFWSHHSPSPSGPAYKATSESGMLSPPRGRAVDASNGPRKLAPAAPPLCMRAAGRYLRGRFLRKKIIASATAGMAISASQRISSRGIPP
jgi:hypothetical protein